jgi:hypothetical protein
LPGRGVAHVGPFAYISGNPKRKRSEALPATAKPKPGRQGQLRIPAGVGNKLKNRLVMNKNIKERLRNSILLFAFSLSVNNIWGQNNNTISINYGYGGDLMLINGFEKEEGFSNDGMFNIGVYYQHKLSKTIAFKTGLNYSKSNILVAAGYHPYWPEAGKESWDTHMLSLPLFINYQFYKYLFLEGGPMVDLQFNIWDSQPTDTQSGVGIGLGMGGIYNYKNINFTLNPFVNYHAIIQFEPYDRERLFEFGIKCGIGYNF